MANPMVLVCGLGNEFVGDSTMIRWDWVEIEGGFDSKLHSRQGRRSIQNQWHAKIFILVPFARLTLRARRLTVFLITCNRFHNVKIFLFFLFFFLFQRRRRIFRYYIIDYALERRSRPSQIPIFSRKKCNFR